MDTLITVTIAAAWLAILIMFAWGVAIGWHRVMSDDGALPIFARLERHGIPAPRAQEASRMYVAAVRRCVLCPERELCREWLARGAQGKAPACPNEAFTQDAARA